MKLIKTGCLAVIIIMAILVVTLSMSWSNHQPPPVVTSPAVSKAAAPDPIEKKYGMTEELMTALAYNRAKAIVRQHCNLPDYQSFPWTTVKKRFFEFEKRDNSGKLIGEWAGVNVQNRFTIKRENKSKSEHSFNGTLHYDPIAKRWHCSSFFIDNEKVDIELGEKNKNQ